MLAGLLAAAVGDVTAVRRPVELLDTAEGLCRELIKLFAQEIQGALGCDGPVHEGGEVGARDFGHPVVPVAVHQVFRGVGLGLVECRIGVGGLDQRGILDGGGIEDLLPVRGDLEFADAGGYLTEFHFLAQFRAQEGRLPELAALDEVDFAAVLGPAGVADALGIAGQLDAAAAVGVTEEKVAATAVVRDGVVTDAVEDLASVRRQLGIRKPAQGKQGFRGHYSVGDLDIGRPDVAAFVRFGIATDHHSKCHEGDKNFFHITGTQILG